MAINPTESYLNGRRSTGSGLTSNPQTLSSQVSAHQERSSQIKGNNTSTNTENKQDWLQTNKTSINKWTNYTAAIASGISFAVANTTDSTILNKVTEFTSFGLTKLSSLASGVINADSAVKASNPLAIVGSVLELPSAFVNNEDYWLVRGIPLFGQNMQAAFSSLGVRDSSGNRSKTETVSSTLKMFSNDIGENIGTFFNNGFKMVKEMPFIITDLFKDFKTFSKSSPHILFASTTLQAIGGMLGLGGYKIAGAANRTSGGIGVDIGLALHDDSHANEPDKPGEKKMSNFSLAGYIWGGAAILDFVKRFEVVSNKFKGLTHFENLLDRFANAFFNEGNNEAGKKARAKLATS